MIDDGGEWWLKEIMKITLFALFTALLMVGCGSPDLDNPETLDKILVEAIDEDKLQERGKEGEELLYAPNEQTPYTGWVKLMRDNGQVKFLVKVKDGKQDGLTTYWYENGQKIREENWKDGKQDGLWTKWHENGQKEYEKNYRDGKLDGFQTHWYENGQKKGEGKVKDGKLIEAVHWKPNGEKCPVTNVKDGNGVMVWYRGDGKEDFRLTYKDGELVKD